MTHRGRNEATSGDRIHVRAGCGEGKVRRFGDLDSRTLASNLPDFNVVRPRRVRVHKRSLIADYAFRQAKLKHPRTPPS